MGTKEIVFLIWVARNNFTFKKELILPGRISESALDLFHEILKASDSPLDQVKAARCVSTRSPPPPPNALKINCDAAVKGSSGTLGCIIRDHSGSIVECFGKQISVSSVYLAEALAVREACLFCVKAGIVQKSQFSRCKFKSSNISKHLKFHI